MPFPFGKIRPLGPSTLSKAWRLIFIGFCLVGFIYRAGAVGSSWLQYDDFAHLRIAEKATVTEAIQEARQHSHPSLGLLVNHFLFRLWGNEFFLRFFSVFMGVLSFLPTFGFWRQLMGRKEAIIGVGLLSLSPLAVTISSEMRTYSLLLFVYFSALYCLQRWLRSKEWRWRIGYVFLAHLSLFIHYCSIIFVASLWVSILIRLLA